MMQASTNREGGSAGTCPGAMLRLVTPLLGGAPGGLCLHCAWQSCPAVPPLLPALLSPSPLLCFTCASRVYLPVDDLCPRTHPGPIFGEIETKSSLVALSFS